MSGKKERINLNLASPNPCIRKRLESFVLPLIKVQLRVAPKECSSLGTHERISHFNSQITFEKFANSFYNT